jgi:hypothetical protein
MLSLLPLASMPYLSRPNADFDARRAVARRSGGPNVAEQRPCAAEWNEAKQGRPLAASNVLLCQCFANPSGPDGASLSRPGPHLRLTTQPTEEDRLRSVLTRSVRLREGVRGLPLRQRTPSSGRTMVLTPKILNAGSRQTAPNPFRHRGEVRWRKPASQIRPESRLCRRIATPTSKIGSGA